MYSDSTGEVWRSLGETSLSKTALDLAEALRREFYGFESEPEELLFSEVAEQCFKVRQKKNRDSTKGGARLIYAQLVAAFGHIPILEFTDRNWIDQLELWEEEGKRTRFFNLQKYARQIDRFAYRQGYRKGRLELPINDPKAREGRRLTAKEFRKIMAAANFPEHQLFLACGYYMGMRKSEILGLPWKRVNLKERFITLREGDTKTGSKTKKGRVFGICQRAMPYFRLVCAQSRSSWVFPRLDNRGPSPSIRSALRGICKRSEIDFKAHDLRHTFFCVKLYEEKKPPMLVAAYAGADLRVIQTRYLHLNVNDTRCIVESSESFRKSGGSQAKTPNVNKGLRKST